MDGTVSQKENKLAQNIGQTPSKSRLGAQTSVAKRAGAQTGLAPKQPRQNAGA